jgi:hypothetical protein
VPRNPEQFRLHQRSADHVLVGGNCAGALTRAVRDVSPELRWKGLTHFPK